eukprot:6194778-Pleurochrysis_carterae.AAC.1
MQLDMQTVPRAVWVSNWCICALGICALINNDCLQQFCRQHAQAREGISALNECACTHANASP